MEPSKLLEFMEFEPAAHRRFQCNWDFCNKSFTRRTDLQRHYRIHTNERPYPCTIVGCGKSFIQHSALVVHLRTHTGEKPHKCQHLGCTSRFSDSSSLARHRRTHTGKLPYKCNYNGCHKSFCRKTTMVKHQRRIHWCGLRQQQVVGGYKSDLSVSEVPPILTQTNMPWPGPTAVVIDQALSRGGQSIYRAAWSGIDPTQRLYQYHMQNASECAIQKQPCVIRHAQSMEITQEPFCIGKQGNVGVAPLGSSMSQFFQGPRALGALSESHSSVEDILYTQNMAAPMSSSPGPSIVSHTSSDRRNTLCTRVGQDSNTYVMHSIATVDQQPTVQLNQWIEQTQTGESYIYSTAAERMQWCHEQAALELARLGRLAG